ncbi:hypothetical protein Ga0061079_1094 [Apibacter mensalis]|uniref:Uncharacterized protein n=1 Tax=Apibacter mensalis TaxID=1586267 RepID=A0A0X3ARC6_9FLAO|nr:hypothetical protein [Apibacter mensalis]CVK16615.1 hypothetical protein Ga0061079_1094 [Apibacter mensalis]
MSSINIFELNYPPSVEIIRIPNFQMLEHEKVSYKEFGNGTFLEIKIDKVQFIYSENPFKINDQITISSGGYRFENHEFIYQKEISKEYIQDMAFRYFYPLRIVEKKEKEDKKEIIILNHTLYLN